MAKKKQFVTAAAAFAVAASAVAPAITADAASTTVRLSSDYVRGGDLNAALDKEYKGSEIHWYKSSIDMNKLGVFQTAKGFVKGKGIKVEKKLRVLNYAQEIKPESEFVFEQGVPVSGIRVQPVLFADGVVYNKPLFVAGFSTEKVGEFEGTLTYSNKAYGSVTKTVKYKVVASKVEFSEVKHEVKDDMLSVSADVKNLKEGEKVELVIFPGKDESKPLDPYTAEIKDGKVTVSAKDIPAGTHSFILRSGDVKTAAMEFKVEAPMVTAVKADNLKTVTISFNKAIDKDSIDIAGTDATVKAMINSSTSTAVTASELSEDGKTLVLTLSGLNQSDKVKVWVDGVKTSEKASVAKFEETYTVTDTVAPVAEGVTVINSKKVKINFSEAVDLDTAGIYKTTDVANSGALVKVDGNLTFAKFTALPGEHAVEVEFFNALSDGSHTIEVSEVKDFAGFKTAAKSFTINTAKDVVAPKATSLEYVSPTSIKVTFDEALKGTSAPTGTFVVKEAGSSDKVNGSTTFSLSSDKKTVTISGLTALSAASIVGYEVTYKNVEDIFGNKLTTDTTISGQVENDAVKPTLTGTEVLDGNTVKVTFSEKVNAAVGNFKLYKADGKTVINTSAATIADYDSVNPDGKTYKVTFAGLNNIDSDTFKVEVSGVTDKSIRANAIEKVMADIVAKDSKAPALTSAVIKADASGDNDKVELVFSEAMDAAQLANIANYYVGNGNATVALTNVSGAKVDSVSADGKKVTLLVPKADVASAGNWSAAINKIAMPTLKDQAGNLISNATLASNFSVAGSYTPISASDIKVEATGKNTIKVTALNGYYFSEANANAFKFKDATNTVANTNNVDLGVVAAQLSADGKTVTLTTSVALTADAKAEATGDSTPDALKLFISGTGVKDQNGQSLVLADTAAVSAGHTNVQDKIVAMQEVPTVSGDVITVSFDEVVAKVSGLSNEVLAAGFELKVGSTTLTPEIDYTAAVNAGKVELTIIKDGVANADVSVELKKPEYLLDANGNAVSPLSAKVVSAVTEAVLPTATVSITGNSDDVIDAGESIVVTFSEATDKPVLTDADFLIGGHTLDLANGSASWNEAGTVLTLTLGSGTTLADADVITLASGSTIEDIAGNDFGTALTTIAATDF